MTDNRTTELREKLDDLIIELDRLDIALDLPASDMTIGEYEQEREKLLDGFTQAIAATLGRPKAKSHPHGYERDTGAYDCTRCECGCINDISATYCNDCGGEIEIDENAEKEYYDGYSKHTVFAKKHDDGSLEFCERRYVPEESITHGTLTAEQVRDVVAIMRKAAQSHDIDDVYDELCEMPETYADMFAKLANMVERDYVPRKHWQAIADELNAELGSGTCEWLYPQSPSGWLGFAECSKCGYRVYEGTIDEREWTCCPHCGARVKAVER